MLKTSRPRGRARRRRLKVRCLLLVLPTLFTVLSVPAAADTPPTVMPSTLSPAKFQGNAAAWGGYIFYVGGYSGVWHREIVRYDPRTGTVTNFGTLPQARVNMGVVTIGNFIYIFGGYNSSLTYFNDVLKFNPSTGGAATVISGATMPSGRCCFPVVTDGSVAYLFGGWNVNLGRSNQILKFNPATNTFTTMSATLPSGRNLAAAAWHNGRAYVMGGNSASGQLREIVEYDPSANTVTTRSEQLPSTLIDFDAVSDGTAIYAVGGMSGTTKQSQILRYDPATSSISTVANLPSGRDAIGVAYTDGSVYVLGGEDQSQGFLSQIVRYGPLCVDNNAANRFDGYTSTAGVTGVKGSIVDRDGGLCATSNDGTSASTAWVMLAGGTGPYQYAQVGFAKLSGFATPLLFTEFNDGSNVAPGWRRDFYTGWSNGSTKNYEVSYDSVGTVVNMYANNQLLATTPWCASCLWTPGWTAQFYGETVDAGDDMPGTLTSKTSFTNLAARYCQACAYGAPVVAVSGSDLTPYKFQWVANPTSFNIWTQR